MKYIHGECVLDFVCYEVFLYINYEVSFSDHWFECTVLYSPIQLSLAIFEYDLMSNTVDNVVVEFVLCVCGDSEKGYCIHQFISLAWLAQHWVCIHFDHVDALKS